MVENDESYDFVLSSGERVQLRWSELKNAIPSLALGISSGNGPVMATGGASVTLQIITKADRSITVPRVSENETALLNLCLKILSTLKPR